MNPDLISRIEAAQPFPGAAYFTGRAILEIPAHTDRSSVVLMAAGHGARLYFGDRIDLPEEVLASMIPLAEMLVAEILDGLAHGERAELRRLLPDLRKAVSARSWQREQEKRASMGLDPLPSEEEIEAHWDEICGEACWAVDPRLVRRATAAP